MWRGVAGSKRVADWNSVSLRPEVSSLVVAERGGSGPALPLMTQRQLPQDGGGDGGPGSWEPSGSEENSSGGATGCGLPSPGEQELSRRLQRLYPAVNQHETPLPRSWSPKDKNTTHRPLRATSASTIKVSAFWPGRRKRRCLRGSCAAQPVLHHVPSPARVLRVGP